MDIVKHYSCYDFSHEWYLVEMLLNISASEIDWSNITVPEENVDRDNWQCAYLEQYLNENGTEKICDTYDIPSEDIKPSRIVFFIYKSSAKLLQTPYGNFELRNPKVLPERLKCIVEFDDVD